MTYHQKWVYKVATEMRIVINLIKRMLLKNPFFQTAKSIILKQNK